MSDSCHKIEDLLPDYLDNVLDRQLRERVDHHLAACQKCRDNLALQRQWLQHRDTVLAAKAAVAAPDGLNQRIMAAIHAENASRQPSVMLNKIHLWRKPWFLRSLAGTAAAVVLFAAVLQFLPDLLVTTSKTSLSQTEAAVLTTAAGLQPTAEDSSTQQTKSASGWALISGQNFDFSRMDQMTVYPGEYQVDTAAEAFGCLASLPDETRGAIADVLEQSADVRVLFRVTPQQQAVILAAFDDNQVNMQADLIKNALAPCETPIQIEIIRTDDLQVKLTGLDQTLFDEVFPDPVAETSWIFILIGA